MTTTTVDEYAQALLLAVQESKPEDHDVVIENLVGVLNSNGDLRKMEDIVARFEVLLAAQGATTQIDATFAREAVQNKQILNELNAIAGNQIEIRSRVDDELVGGMVLRVDDTLIDASVKGQLDRMKKDLSE